MHQYQIKGETYSGDAVDTKVRASSETVALRFILIKYRSKLKKGYQIVKTMQVTELPRLPEVKPIQPLKTFIHDSEIRWIGNHLFHNIYIDHAYVEKFFRYFAPMVESAVRKYWNEVTLATQQEKISELYEDIIYRILPRYDRQRSRLRRFVRFSLQKKVQGAWGHEKYVNAGKSNKRPRFVDLQEYFRQQETVIGLSVDPEAERQQMINICKRIVRESAKVKPKARRELFGWIVKEGLHIKLLRSTKQIRTMQMIYGEGLKETEAAVLLGIEQPAVHISKRRAEANILERIEKCYP